MVRLIAIKLDIDPILRRQYKPGSPGWESAKRLVTTRRFVASILLFATLLVLFSAYAVHTALNLAHQHTADSHFMLIFGPVFAVVLFVAIFAVLYGMLVRKH
jgi:hypothetical protein